LTKSISLQKINHKVTIFIKGLEMKRNKSRLWSYWL